jgi:diguanylate cyclase (GGDEF)-like protein
MKRSGRFNHPLSMLMFDIDDFKNVNDTYGHSFGDHVLKTIADIVRKQMRDVDHLIRWGGEEFLVIAIETNLEGAKTFAERLRKILENHSFGKDATVKASFGVTSLRKDDSESNFIKRADDAMYRAKRNGKNRVEALS